MFPVRAGVEIPVETSGRECAARRWLPDWRDLEGRARVPAKLRLLRTGEADTIGVGKLVAEIAGEGAIEKSVILPLAVGLEVGARSRVIKGTEKALTCAPAAGAGKTAAFGKKSKEGVRVVPGA